jgi:hypothetical protein
MSGLFRRSFDRLFCLCRWSSSDRIRRAPGKVTLSGFLNRPFQGSVWHVNAFFLVTDKWAEAYVGPSWDIASWISVGFSVGAQQGVQGLGLRYAASLWFGNRRWSFFGITEFDNASFARDASGVWYDLTAKTRVAGWLDVGLKSRRFVGIGPYVALRVPSTSIWLWVAWTPWDPEVPDKTRWTQVVAGGKLFLE